MTNPAFHRDLVCRLFVCLRQTQVLTRIVADYTNDTDPDCANYTDYY